jgi:alanine racemase
MDMCMADVSGIPDCKVGDVATVFGIDPSADELAEKAGTINYEIVCSVSKRVPRVYVY